MRVAVIGGVTSTAVLLNKLSQHAVSDVRVFGYSPSDTKLVSGWIDLCKISKEAGYDYLPFVSINDTRLSINEFAPDWLFAVGVSQLIPTDLLEIPKQGAIGFHPTALPRGRGRAPIAWLVLEQHGGAATFFLMREGVDDGPILCQIPFPLVPSDDAKSVEVKLLESEALALDILIPAIKNGLVRPVEQDHTKATYYGRRMPEDGWLDWSKSAENLVRLVRASSPPHPGSFTYQGSVKIYILSATIIFDVNEKGVVGRILQLLDNKSFVVQCGSGYLKVIQWESEFDWHPRVGSKLGYYTEVEVYQLYQRIAILEERLVNLERNLNLSSSNFENK